MEKFYFTFGESGIQPYEDGWAEVEAPDLSIAIRAFANVHPSANNSITCEGYFTEDGFNRYEREKQLEKGGHGCRERIRATREVDAIGYLADDPIMITEKLTYQWETIEDPVHADGPEE